MLSRIYNKRNRVLLSELVRTDFKLRYQGSILGYAWSLLRPLMLFLILYVVFAKFLKVGDSVPHFPVYLLIGIVLWNFFAEMTSLSLGSIVGRGDLIRKIKIPRWIIVLSSSISALINLGLNLLVIAVFMIANHVDLLQTTLWLPLLFVEMYVFSLGVSLFLAAAFVRYRDVSYIWEVTTQGLFYLTPVLYPLALITNTSLQKLLLISPAGQIIQDSRYALVTHQTLTTTQVYGEAWYRIIPVAITLFILLAGVFYFRRESKYFAENI